MPIDPRDVALDQLRLNIDPLTLLKWRMIYMQEKK